MSIRAITFGAVFLVVASAGAWAEEAFFMGLGDLADGATSSYANGVSADGQVAVGCSKPSPSVCEPFLWSPETGMIGLGGLVPGAYWGKALAVSENGAVVVGWSEWDGDGQGLREAFRWSAADGMVGLGDLNPWLPKSAAFGVSSDGSVIVGYGQSDEGWEASRWTSTTGMVGLGDLAGGAYYSEAHGVSSDGSVIVGESRSSNGAEAFRWTEAEGLVGIGDLPGGDDPGYGDFFSDAHGVSGDGLVIVGRSISESGMEAFRWAEADGMVGLGDLSGGAFQSRASSTSWDGAIVVGLGNSPEPTGQEAFIWDAVNGMRGLKSVIETEYGLSLSGWDLRDATGVSADGRTIVGWGADPTGRGRAWIAHLGTPVDCLGDLNDDRSINLADLAALLSNYGATSGAGYEDGDLNGDQAVTLHDLAILLSNYGAVCP